MRIEKISLQGFGAFNHGLEVDLGDSRLSLVVGRNETGKSTLLNAAFGILFGFRDQNLQSRFEPWEEHTAYAGSVTLLTDAGVRIRIQRDFRAGTARIEEETRDGDNRTVWTTVLEGSASPRGSRESDARYFRKIGEILGFQDETVFRNTVFVGQSSLQTSITDQIRRLISGSSSADYRGALHELHARFADLTTRNPWRGPARSNRKLIERTEDRLLGDMERLEDGRNLLVRSVELESEIDGIETRILSLGEEKAADEAALAKYEAFFAARQAAETADRRFEEALRRRDAFGQAEARMADVEARIKRGYRKFLRTKEDFDENIRTLIAEEQDRARDRAELTANRGELSTLRPVPNTRLGVILAIVGAAAAAGGGAALGYTLPLFAGAAAVLAPALFFAGRAMGTGFRETRAALVAVIRKAEETTAGREARIAAIRADLADVIEDDDLESLRVRFREYTALRDERGQRVAALRALGDRSAAERLFSEAALEQSHARTTLQSLTDASPWLQAAGERPDLGREIEEMRRRVAAATAELESLEHRHAEARVEQARIAGRMDFDLAALEESVGDNERRLADLELEREALRVAIDTLDDSVREFQEGDVHRLETEISSLFARITGDRYVTVRLTGSMEPVLERGDRVNIDPDSLSQGARDQLYFAMRVAMARHLSRRTKLPFFLDDPFVNFDEERLKVTRELLGHLEDHQIIMVTCNRAYEPWADRILDMDRAAETAAAGAPRMLG